MKKTDFQLNKRIEGIQKISTKYHGSSFERFFGLVTPNLVYFGAFCWKDTRANCEISSRKDQNFSSIGFVTSGIFKFHPWNFGISY